MINNPVRKQLPTLENPGTAIDLRSGKSLIAPDGSVVTGTLPEVEQATPSISVSSGGLITTTAVQVGGIVADGTKSAIQQLPTQGAATITPGTTAKTAIAEGRYTTGDIKVAGDANLVAENIAEGVNIFGVTGTHSGGGEFITVLVRPDATMPWELTFVDQNGVFQHISVPSDSNDKTIFLPKGSILAASNTSPVHFSLTAVEPAAAGSYFDGFGSYMDGRGFWVTYLALSEDTTISL